MVERFNIEKGRGIGCPRCFAVVERYDQDIVCVGKEPVPCVVVSWRPNRESAAVEGKKGRQECRGGEIVLTREEYPVKGKTRQLPVRKRP
jgi:hypothetical protein